MNSDTPKPSSRIGQVLVGLLLVAVGVVLLMDQLGYYFPAWFFTWPMILIIIGVAKSLKSLFRDPGGIFIALIGAAFLLDSIYPTIRLVNFIWPITFIGLGLLVIFGRKPNHHRWDRAKERWQAKWDEKCQASSNIPHPPVQGQGSNEAESIDFVSVFGSNQKTVFSKNFTGGEITTFMGGTEINLSQADIQGRVTLEVTQVMGGSRIIIPPHWSVISEMTAVLGGIEDKRTVFSGSIDPNKVLILKGTSVMGGIEILSFA